MTYIWILSWFALFVIGLIVCLVGDISDRTWMNFWYFYLKLITITSVGVIIWFAIGGVKDLIFMIRKLKTMTRNDKDDGFVGH